MFIYEQKLKEIKEKQEELRAIAKKFNYTEEDIKLSKAIKNGNTEEALNILRERFKNYKGFQW